MGPAAWALSGLPPGEGPPRDQAGLPLSPPPLLCRMAPAPHASACLHFPQRKAALFMEKSYFGSTVSLNSSDSQEWLLLS